MSVSDRERLQHMLEYTIFALHYIPVGKDRLTVENVLALVKAIEIIGEAATKLSREFRAAHPELPWRDIQSMRNRLVHDYYDIDLDRLWDTLAQDLPRLKPLLEEWLALL